MPNYFFSNEMKLGRSTRIILIHNNFTTYTTIPNLPILLVINSISICKRLRKQLSPEQIMDVMSDHYHSGQIDLRRYNKHDKPLMRGDHCPFKLVITVDRR